MVEPGLPSRELFEPDQSTIAISKLQELVADTSQAEATVGAADDLLPTLAPVVPKRILWDIQSNGQSLNIKPFIQQKKKRGDGFTKGKKISLERLRTHHGAAETEADRSVIECIRRSEYSYFRSNEYELDVTEALPNLVGQENVAFDGQPITVQTRPLFLAIGKSDSGSGIFLTEEESDTK